MTQHQALTQDVLAFLEKTGMAKTKFGRLAVGDFNLVDNLIAGREPRSATAQRIRAKLDELAGAVE